MADTYHPIDWTQLVVASSGAFPLPHEVRKNPDDAWWTLPQLNTEYPQERAIAPVLTMPYLDGECPDSPLVEGNYQGYYQEGPYRGFFLVSSLKHGRIIGPVIEHFPPGATTWPDDVKPQFRVPQLMQQAFNEMYGCMEATYEVTVTEATGLVANPRFGDAEATFGVTVTEAEGVVDNADTHVGSVTATFGATTTQGNGTVTNGGVVRVGNTGVFFKRKPSVKQPEVIFQLPVPEAPTVRIAGAARSKYGATKVQGLGEMRRPVFGATTVVTLAVTQARGQGKVGGRPVSGYGASQMSVTWARGSAINDRSLRNQIEEEDQWLQQILNALVQGER